MLKGLLIFAVAAIMTVGVSGTPNDDANKGDDKPKQQPACLLHPVCECKPANDATHEQAKANASPPKWYASFKWTDWLPIIIASLALGAVCYQALLSRDIARRQLRAYVCLSGASIMFNDTGTPEIQVEMKNGGLTPAYDMRFWIGLAIGEHPLKRRLGQPPAGFQMGVSVMPPTGTETMIAQWQRNIPTHILAELGTPQRTLYVYGRAEYRDAFSARRFTEFRLIFGGPESMRVQDKDGSIGGGLKPDTDGNRAD
ncbi:MAG: hypothetical protein ABR976_10530 [Terracidiphilus sp.]|jgi:hypothetical protein